MASPKGRRYNVAWGIRKQEERGGLLGKKRVRHGVSESMHVRRVFVGGVA